MERKQTLVGPNGVDNNDCVRGINGFDKTTDLPYGVWYGDRVKFTIPTNLPPELPKTRPTFDPSIYS